MTEATKSPPAEPDEFEPDPTTDKLDAAVFKVAGVVVLGAIMSILDVTVVNVAQPTFQDTFHVTPATAAWTATAYMLALAAIIPVTGWAADRFGTKRLYMAAVLMFTVGSGLCALADNIELLIGFRVLQGLGGGMLMPLGMTIMTHAAGPHRVGRVMAVLGIPMLLGPIGGPILGGWLIEKASWHWIFLINIPIGVVALVYAQVVLAKDKPHKSESFDWLGMALLSPGLACFLYGVSSIPEEGTINSSKVISFGVIGLALIMLFVAHALRKEHALIDLSLFKNRNMTISVVTFLLFIIAFMGSMLLLPSYFLQVRGETTLQAGLLIAPQGIGAMLTMPVSGKLVDKIGPGKIVLTGIVLICVGLSTFTYLDADTSYWLLEGSLFVMGLGMGCTMMPLMTSALATLSARTTARGSTLMNVVQQTAGSIGAAVMSVILTNEFKDTDKHPQLGVAMKLKDIKENHPEMLNPAFLKTHPQVLQQHPEIAQAMKPGFMHTAMEQMANSFSTTFTVAIVLVALTLIPAIFLPRKKIAAPDGAAPAMMH